MIKTNDLISKDIKNEIVTREDYKYNLHPRKSGIKKHSSEPIIKIHHKTRAPPFSPLKDHILY